MCLSLALVAAAPPKRPVATPTPAPTLAPTATPAPHQALPLVVVYPFLTSADIKAGVGQSASQLFVQQINADGGLDAIAAPATIARANYRSYAQSLNADYYVTGYMTPLGGGVSLVEQVVSTREGTIVYGQTAQIDSFQDATAQATAVHDGIVALEQQMSAAYNQAQAQATSTPMANNQANLTKGISGLAGLFKHRGKATPAPVTSKPPKGVLVAHVGGSLPASDLQRATTELYNALQSRFNARMTTAAGENLAKTADGICGADRNNTIATGTASAKVTHRTFGSSAQYTFVMDVYTCFGAKLAQTTGTGGSLADAVRSAVSDYASKYPQNG
jgi:TolB-like protein